MPIVVYVYHNPRDHRDYVSVGKSAQPMDFVTEVKTSSSVGKLFGLQFAVDYKQPLWRNAIESVSAYLAPNAFFRRWSGAEERLDQTQLDEFRDRVQNTINDVTQNKQKGADREAKRIDAIMRS